MADHLASIYGTEKDKVNCSFYFKIGACRHGDRCSRKHVKPTFSQTVLLQNIYQNPGHNPFCTLDAKQLQEHFDAFYEDIFIELAKYGEVEKLNVCDNVGDHLVGNVYIKYRHEEDASNAVEALNNRFYSGRHIYAELSPVTDFGEACCRQYENSECVRNGFCNFMHLKAVTPKLAKELYLSQEKYLQNLRMAKYSSKNRKRDSSKSNYDRSDHKGRRGRNHDSDEYRGESRYSRRDRRWSARHERGLSDEDSDKLKKSSDSSNHAKRGIEA